MKKQLTGFFTALLLAASVPGYATTISSGGFPTGYTAFGERSGVWDTVGQTFSLNPGDDTTLDSITFYINDYTDLSAWASLDNIDFALYLYEWDGSKITGSSLYTSGALTTASDVPGYEAFTINTGGVSLTTGTDYVFFVSTSLFQDGYLDQGVIGVTGANQYAGGNIVLKQNDTDFGQLSTSAWVSSPTIDLTFTMQLSPDSPTSVPEPSTLLLLGSGLSGFALIRRFRKS